VEKTKVFDITSSSGVIPLTYLGHNTCGCSWLLTGARKCRASMAGIGWNGKRTSYDWFLKSQNDAGSSAATCFFWVTSLKVPGFTIVSTISSQAFPQEIVPLAHVPWRPGLRCSFSALIGAVWTPGWVPSRGWRWSQSRWTFETWRLGPIVRFMPMSVGYGDFEKNVAYLSIYPSIYPSIHLIYLSNLIYQSINQSIYLSNPI